MPLTLIMLPVVIMIRNLFKVHLQTDFWRRKDHGIQGDQISE